ncbi:hypothetical protein IPZ70_33175 [Streptomyces polychromogenes]|nr:hypothetical protein [Streptomyces polychromogenes]
MAALDPDVTVLGAGPGVNGLGVGAGVTVPGAGGVTVPGAGPGVNGLGVGLGVTVLGADPSVNGLGVGPGVTVPGADLGVNGLGVGPGVTAPGADPGVNGLGVGPGVTVPGADLGVNGLGVGPGVTVPGADPGVNGLGVGPGVTVPGADLGVNGLGVGPGVTVPGAGPGVSGRALVRLGAGVDAVEVDAADAPRAALLAAEYFLDSADAAGNRAWRVSELTAENALDAREFALRLGAAGIAAGHRPEVAWPYAEPPRPWGEYGAGLCVLPPLGRLSSAQWRVLAEAAGGADGELRLTPWRSVILPRAAAGAAGRVEAAGLAVRPGSPWLSVTACTGRPGCAKSLADVRADARAVVAQSAGGLPVHWSGCARRCGHPRGTAWVDLVATPDGYELDGGPVPHADLAAALTAARTTPTTPTTTEAATEAAVKK